MGVFIHFPWIGYKCRFRRYVMSSMTASALLKSRVRRPSMLNKLSKTSDLIELFPNGASVGWSGFTGVGYPK